MSIGGNARCPYCQKDDNYTNLSELISNQQCPHCDKWLEVFIAANGGIASSTCGKLNSKEEHVDHPQHYGGDTPYEAIKVIEAWELGFHLGNAVKYISRAGKKDDTEQDIKKAMWYLDRHLKNLLAP